jgi:2'-5' RNA ligase
MTKIAVDIAILPPEEIMEMAIALNREMGDESLVLDKESCLPHITLCMGVLREEELPKVREAVAGVAREFDPIRLRIEALNGEYLEFLIGHSQELQRLHEAIMRAAGPYLTQDATAEMCHSPPRINEKSLAWINSYRENSAFDRFRPHITVGRGKSEARALDVAFTATRIGICQLGDHCTCRKVLGSVELGH